MEVDDVLKAGHKRRQASVDQHLAQLFGSGDAADDASAVGRGVAAAETQTNQTHFACTKEAEKELEKCWKRAALSSRPANKVYGPTKLHREKTGGNEPSEKTEDPVKEGVTLTQSLATMTQNVGARGRQNESLRSQLEVCEAFRDKRRSAAELAEAELAKLRSGDVAEVMRERLQRRRERVAELRSEAAEVKRRAEHFRKLTVQQQAYLVHCDIASGDALKRHRAGEVFTAPRPASMADENVDTWDVGTAVANPYVVDSWPFEPNVLASRTNKEATFQPLREETEEDIDSESSEEVEMHPEEDESEIESDSDALAASARSV